MPLVAKDRVKETTTTTGTGTLTLAGAATGFQAFSAIGNGNTCRYALLDANGTAWEVGIGTYTLSGTTLARTTIIASTNSNNAINLSAGTHTVFCDWPAVDGIGAVSAAQAVTPGGRLTLTTAVPVTTADVTGATNVYYTPYLHNIINLWNGSIWTPIVFAEVTQALGTISAAQCYDVFGYLSSGALATEILAWTNATTRATAITLQDGRYCKSGDKTRLYLGTFYTTATTTTEDSEAKRFLWNMYNRVRRAMYVHDSTDTWTYSTATVRQANNNAANQLDYVCGLAEDAVEAYTQARVASSGTTARSTLGGVGVDSTTALSGLYGVRTASSAINQQVSGSYAGYPGVGRHYLAWLEYGAGADTQTWHGDTGNSLITKSGIGGSVWA